MGGSRRWIMRECENSLRRLNTDHLDLYQMHRSDPNVDIDETLGALSDLVHQGKVRYLGSSTWPASAIVEAQWVAEKRQRERFVCEQPPYSILVRGIEADVLPTCLRHDMAVIPWSPLAGGWLSGKWRKDGERVSTHRANRMPARYDLDDPGNQQKLDAADALGRLADDAGIPLVHLAVAWVLRNPAVTSAIIGPRTMEQLTTQLGAADVDLDDDVLDRIDEIVPPGTTFTWADAGWASPMIADARARRAVCTRTTTRRPACCRQRCHSAARPRSTTRSVPRATRAGRGGPCRCRSASRSCRAWLTCSKRATTRPARSTHSTTARR
jgi:aryl-alcohol dehydrogenase-like predicted oxidoreductase